MFGETVAQSLLRILREREGDEYENQFQGKVGAGGAGDTNFFNPRNAKRQLAVKRWSGQVQKGANSPTGDFADISHRLDHPPQPEVKANPNSVLPRPERRSNDRRLAARAGTDAQFLKTFADNVSQYYQSGRLSGSDAASLLKQAHAVASDPSAAQQIQGVVNGLFDQLRNLVTGQ